MPLAAVLPAVLLGASPAHGADPAQAAPGTPSPVVGVVTYRDPGILLAVELQDGTGQRVSMPVRLDTGATLTTLSREALASLSIPVPDDAPLIVASTANGPRRSHLLLLDRMWVGGHLVAPVTVAVCDECADLDSAGLLGLNVTDRFATHIDPAHQRVAFSTLIDHQGQRTDVGAWTGLSASMRGDGSGRGELEVGVASDAPRVIDEVRVRVTCGVEREVSVGPIPARSRARRVVQVDSGLLCDELELRVLDARWGS